MKSQEQPLTGAMVTTVSVFIAIGTSTQRNANQGMGVGALTPGRAQRGG